MIYVFCFVFFFSSRRRHTRCSRDWSSDVCSSDLLGGYYLLKTAREIFILSEGGAEVKSYSSAGQALLLLLIVPAYSAFASRVNRTQLVQWVTVFFAVNLVLFLLALEIGLHIGVVYFLWLGIFNVMV